MLADFSRRVPADVIVPAARKAVCDAVKGGIDILLYGDTKKKRRSSTASETSYHRAYSSPARINSGFDYDRILFETRGDAEVVLDTMQDYIDKYQFVSVADLYELAQVRCDNYNANKYGWTDITTAKSVRVQDGYALKLPRALPLD